jgi:hypothetical protein
LAVVMLGIFVPCLVCFFLVKGNGSDFVALLVAF